MMLIRSTGNNKLRRDGKGNKNISDKQMFSEEWRDEYTQEIEDSKKIYDNASKKNMDVFLKNPIYLQMWKNYVSSEEVKKIELTDQEISNLNTFMRGFYDVPFPY
jgi:hypothetical protein